jgi:hypothetical protein
LARFSIYKQPLAVVCGQCHRHDLLFGRPGEGCDRGGLLVLQLDHPVGERLSRLFGAVSVIQSHGVKEIADGHLHPEGERFEP